MSSIVFRKHFVRDTETNEKAKVHYSLDNRIDGRKCVTIYEKDYERNLHKIFENATDNSDIMTDYIEFSKVVLFESHPLYNEARQYVENLNK